MPLALNFYRRAQLDQVIKQKPVSAPWCTQSGGMAQRSALNVQGLVCLIRAGPEWVLSNARRFPKARSSSKSLSGLSLPWDTIPIRSVLEDSLMLPMGYVQRIVREAGECSWCWPPSSASWERVRGERGSAWAREDTKHTRPRAWNYGRNPGSCGVILSLDHAGRHASRDVANRCVTKAKLGYRKCWQPSLPSEGRGCSLCFRRSLWAVIFPPFCA